MGTATFQYKYHWRKPERQSSEFGRNKGRCVPSQLTRPARLGSMGNGYFCTKGFPGVINIVSEHFLEAVNACSIDAPYGVSEFAVSGLHPVNDTRLVKAPRVKEAVFSIEVKLIETRAFKSKIDQSKTSCVLATMEGVRFWAREDVINDEKNQLNPEVSW
jgi:Flavin reductase like domain